MHDQILDLLRRGDTDAALQQARVAVVATPHDPAVHRQLAMVLQRTGDRASARAAIEHAIELAPDDPDAHFDLATLLFAERQPDAAQAALGRSIALDPNQFDAYLVQAQLALGRGDLDEAERQRKLAARVEPEHPHLAAIDGMLALRRGDGEQAQVILATALKHAPEDPQLLYALGFAYLQLGHLAFAEQAMRKVIERVPTAVNLHALVADLLRQQGRPADAAEAMAPLLADPATATPGLARLAGELELEANRPQDALKHLRQALAGRPDDPRILRASLEAWRRVGNADDARSTLDAALATTRESRDLWQARLALEAPGSAGAKDVIERWLNAMPASVEAHELHMADQILRNDADGANQTAAKILQLEPGRHSAELRLFQDLLERDPAAAVARCESLLPQIRDPQARARVESWLALAHDRAGHPAQAVALWQSLHAEQSGQRIAPWSASASRTDWPQPGAVDPQSPRAALLWGAPGSGVERVAGMLAEMLPALRSDRFGPRPPKDPFQRFAAIGELQDGTLAPDQVVSRWREALAARNLPDGQVIDWLPYWDNVLLLALRPHLPGAQLLVVLRDPRDMLLDWLAFGAPLPLALTSATDGARWLSSVLAQVADLHEGDLHPHRLLRVDDSLDDGPALARQLGEALPANLPVPPRELGPARFAAGHWRDYRDALGAAFALLAPVAVRLGYPEA
ncbi:MAG: tetratricopeptide repeat protein [Thermomonas sp.]